MDAAYEMGAILRTCKEQRLRREKAQDIARRISKIDPKDNTRVAMVPIDSRSVGIPRDLRRNASYTTLYVLGTGCGQRSRSRWERVRLALKWMIAYWRADRLGMTISEAKLNTPETDAIAPFANLIKVSTRSDFITEGVKQGPKTGVGFWGTGSSPLLTNWQL